MRGVICDMEIDDKHWNEFLNDGETTIKISVFQGILIKILAKNLLYLMRNKVSKKSIFGSLRWNVLEGLKWITKLISPRAYEIFMFWVESLWVLADLEKKKLSTFWYQCRFIRKEKYTEKDLKMSSKVFQKVHEIRNHI